MATGFIRTLSATAPRREAHALIGAVAHGVVVGATAFGLFLLALLFSCAFSLWFLGRTSVLLSPPVPSVPGDDWRPGAGDNVPIDPRPSASAGA